MSDGQVETSYREILFHNDDETPLQFVVGLIHSVFKKPLADTFRFTDAIRDEGKASCGIYPHDVANELLEAARQRIDESGHPLRITSRKTVGENELFDESCKLCGDLAADNQVSLKG